MTAAGAGGRCWGAVTAIEVGEAASGQPPKPGGVWVSCPWRRCRRADMSQLAAADSPPAAAAPSTAAAVSLAPPAPAVVVAAAAVPPG